MEETKKAPQYNLVGAVLFALVALFSLIGYLMQLRYGFYIITTAITMLFIGGSGILSASLFLRRGDSLTLSGFALLAISSLINLVIGLRYGALSFIVNIFGFLGYLGALAVAVASFTNFLDPYKDKIQRLWFVPALCFAAQIVVSFFGWVIALALSGMIYRVSFWMTLLCAAAILFACLWSVFPQGMPKKQYAANADGYRPAEAVSEQDGYFELAVHVLLLLFTFGIWYYIWIYRMTKYLNCVQDEEPRNPVTKLLLCMFVPFYSIYWIYKSAQRIDKLAQSKGMQSDLSTLCLILAIFIGIIPPILMQDKVNAIIRGKAAPAATAAPVQPQAEAPQAKPVNAGVPEELKKYKELLDSGVITQEEFDLKKKQLLDL